MIILSTYRIEKEGNGILKVVDMPPSFCMPGKHYAAYEVFGDPEIEKALERISLLEGFV